MNGWDGLEGLNGLEGLHRLEGLETQNFKLHNYHSKAIKTHT